MLVTAKQKVLCLVDIINFNDALRVKTDYFFLLIFINGFLNLFLTGVRLSFPFFIICP